MSTDALEKASIEQRDDKSFVTEALRLNGASLFLVSDRLRNDIDVVKIAVNNDINAFQYVSKNLRDNKNFVLEVVRMWGVPLQFASDRLRNDKQVVVAAVKARASSVQYASQSLRADNVFIEALKKVAPDVNEWL